MTATRQQRAELLIVGGGPAGLATAGVARRMGIQPLIVDKADGLGGAWARMRPDMRCLSPRPFDRLPDGSYPLGPGDRATAAEVLAWLLDYAARERFDARLGRAVTALRPEGDELVVELGEEALRARRAVIASGEHGRPRTPQLPGRFGGVQSHSSTLDIDEIGADERVLVVGARNSAAELVRLLLERGAQVVVAARSGLPPAVGAPSGWAAALRWRLSGIPLRYLPARGLCGRDTPLVDSTMHDALRLGQIEVVGEATQLHDDGVTCGARRVLCDRIVWATGFWRDIGWLDRAVRRDAYGVPLHVEGISVDWPQLGFVGLPCMRTRRSGFLRGFSADARAVLERLL